MLLIIGAFTAMYVICGRADSWALPEPTKYYSSDKQYYIEILPRKLESQMKYFDDKVEGREPAGSAKGLKDNFCKGVFYKRNEKLEYRGQLVQYIGARVITSMKRTTALF